MVIEDCFRPGCLGEQLAAWLAETAQGGRRVILKNLDETFASEGSVAELEHRFGLDASGIAASVREALRGEQ